MNRYCYKLYNNFSTMTNVYNVSILISLSFTNNNNHSLEASIVILWLTYIFCTSITIIIVSVYKL